MTANSLQAATTAVQIGSNGISTIPWYLRMKIRHTWHISVYEQARPACNGKFALPGIFVSNCDDWKVQSEAWMAQCHCIGKLHCAHSMTQIQLHYARSWWAVNQATAEYEAFKSRQHPSWWSIWQSGLNRTIVVPLIARLIDFALRRSTSLCYLSHHLRPLWIVGYEISLLSLAVLMAYDWRDTMYNLDVLQDRWRFYRQIL